MLEAAGLRVLRRLYELNGAGHTALSLAADAEQQPGPEGAEQEEAEGRWYTRSVSARDKEEVAICLGCGERLEWRVRVEAYDLLVGASFAPADEDAQWAPGGGGEGGGGAAADAAAAARQQRLETLSAKAGGPDEAQEPEPEAEPEPEPEPSAATGAGSSAPEPRTVVAAERLAAGEGETLRGAFEATESGVLCLVLDNTASWTKSKTVRYALTIAPAAEKA